MIWPELVGDVNVGWPLGRDSEESGRIIPWSRVQSLLYLPLVELAQYATQKGSAGKGKTMLPQQHSLADPDPRGSFPRLRADNFNLYLHLWFWEFGPDFLLTSEDTLERSRLVSGLSSCDQMPCQAKLGLASSLARGT
jgi:hypothetical protein